MIVYGPVPSRRLGRSLGINNIPPKMCSYSCCYCQVGRTRNMQTERQAFYRPGKIVRELRKTIGRAVKSGETIDYLTFVPDGEPTLDVNLGRVLEILKPFGIKIGVITNSSLIWRDDVKRELMNADWISFKLDSTDVGLWRRTDRPHGSLNLDAILNGILEFASHYRGVLTTETMLVKDVNDSDECLASIGAYLSWLKPAVAYLSIPTRPPAEAWAVPAAEETINRAYHIFKSTVDCVEYLIGYEGNAFASTGHTEDDILSITAVHPMREEAVDALLRKSGDRWSVIRRLVSRGKLLETEYEGKKYYIRRFSNAMKRAIQ